MMACNLDLENATDQSWDTARKTYRSRLFAASPARALLTSA